MGNLGLTFLRQGIRDSLDRFQAFFVLLPLESVQTALSRRCPQEQKGRRKRARVNYEWRKDWANCALPEEDVTL